MRCTQIPAVLLVAACAAAGCSKRAEAPESRTQQLPVPAAVTPAPVPEAVDQKPAQVIGEVAPAKIPNNVKSLVKLSRLLIDQGRIDEALAHLTHAGEMAPDSGDVQRLLGRADLARVEGVKLGHEEPFDLEAVATVGR